MIRMNQVAVGMCTILLLFFSSVYSNAIGKIPIEEQDTQDVILKKVMQSPAIGISFENPAEQPLVVQSASAKTITSTEYHQLMGSASGKVYTSVGQYTTFPTVTVVNNTNKRITAFNLSFGNKVIARNWWGIYPTGLSIEPNGTFTISPHQWVGLKGDPVQNLRSPKMWLPGSASDLFLLLVRVEFEDGSRWVSYGKSSL